MNLDINALYNAGVKALQQVHEKEELNKLNVLRAGNTGAVYGTTWIGTCARQSLLRYEGIKYDETKDEKRLMFDAGFANEDIWVKCLSEGLKASGISNVSIRCEEEIPISWRTPSDYKVSGRPDLVLGTLEGETFTPLMGLELKLINSVWTARDKGVLLEPDLSHLLQAGHYAWQLNVPFQLWYTNRSEFAIGSGWEQKTIPKEEDMLTSVVERGEKKDFKTGKLTSYSKKISQFRQGFELEWTQGRQLRYRPIIEGQSLEWTYTPITIEGIIAYYEAVVKQKENKELAPRPTRLKADGSPGNFNACEYCSLKKICDSSDNEYETWVSEVQALLTR